ncbi:MAG: hypothetical protein J7L54_01935 [Elusimicrobia bacterium]|nr:hypothetical protein [Elusimicrobiota bacterium]
MLEIIRKKLKEIVEEQNITDGEVVVTAKALTPEEAIGNPEHDDYPLLKGRERLMEAKFRDFRGVAFSDMFGNFRSTLSEILSMELKNNFRRAIFVATANAVLRELNLIERTIHCRNEDLTLCAGKLYDFIKENFGSPKIFLCGLQPRFAEELTSHFETKITDMDKNNFGRKFSGVEVASPDKAGEYIKWCDLIFATGSTFVNNTARKLIESRKKIVFYGVTGASPCFLLKLRRYCPCGK